MKKTIKISFLRSIFFAVTASTLMYSSYVFALSSHDMMVLKDGKCVGFTDKAKALIKNSREALRMREEVFSNKFRQFESVYHAAHIMRMLKGNMFLSSCKHFHKMRFLYSS